MSPATLMYAELLPNIRQISVVAAIPTPSNSSTNAELSDDSRRVVLHHDGNATILSLPGQAGPLAQLQNCALASKELSWRLQVAGAVNRVDFDSAQSNDAPWSARHLDGSSEFRCRGCDTVAVKVGTIKDWRDMPSDNWAEMMDFWHCHKPHDHGTNGTSDHGEEVAASKGYGANTKFRAQAGVGFVGRSTFLVASTDCLAIEPAPLPEDTREYQKLSCTACREYIGYMDHDAEGFRLFKWRLSLSTPPLVAPAHGAQQISIQQPSMTSIIVSQMLALIQSQCTSRLLLYPLGWSPSARKSSLTPLEASSDDSGSVEGQPSSKFLCIWSLVPSLRISSTNTEKMSSFSPATLNDNENSGTLAMKVFWREVSTEEAENLMDDTNSEQLALPEEAIVQLGASLRESALLLPPSMRTFKEWGTGLLERYEEKG